MASIFTRIINGEIPCYKVAEDDRFIAFLDVRPLQPGHTLVVPKKEVDYIFDLDEKTLSDLIIFTQKVAVAMKKVIDCKRIGIAVVGLEVPHAHVHLVPLQKEKDLLFTNPRVSLPPEENERLAKAIGDHLKL
jgi:histidine triad (HIT) family protein